MHNTSSSSTAIGEMVPPIASSTAVPSSLGMLNRTLRVMRIDDADAGVFAAKSALQSRVCWAASSSASPADSSESSISESDE
jgi:hypothetical protein